MPPRHLASPAVPLLAAGPARAASDPTQPIWSAVQNAMPGGILSLVFLALLLLALAVRHRMRLHRRAIRREVAGLPDAARFRVLDAMAHAMRLRGRIDPDRLRRAVEIARQVTDMDFTAVHLRELAERADRIHHPLSFRWMRRGLTQKERFVIFNAAASTVVASGRPDRRDRALLRNLSRGLGLKRRDLRDLSGLVAA